MVAKKKKREKKKEKRKNKKIKNLRTVFARAIDAFEVKQGLCMHAVSV